MLARQHIRMLCLILYKLMILILIQMINNINLFISNKPALNNTFARLHAFTQTHQQSQLQPVFFILLLLKLV